MQNGLNIQPRLWLSISLTVASLFSAPSWGSAEILKAEACGASLASDAMIERMPLQSKYKMNSDLAEFKDDLILHITEQGHAMIWYKNQRLDTYGVPFLTPMFRFSRGLSFLPPGMIFVFRGLPSDFATTFEAYVDQMHNAGFNSCVSAACATLRKLGVFARDEAHYQRPTTLLRYLWSLRNEDRRGRDLRVIALGVDPKEFLSDVELSQNRRITPITLLGSALAGISFWTLLILGATGHL